MRSSVLEPVQAAAAFLRKQSGGPKVLIKISKNLGDTLHGLPIIKHFRTLYADAAIAYMICQSYHNAHELNPDLSKGGLFLLPNDITPQERLQLWPIINSFEDIDLKILPSINPFRELYPQNNWVHACIADQYLANASIANLIPAGGRHYTITISLDDTNWAEQFFREKSLNPHKTIVFEYNSYSHPLAWHASHWQSLFKLMPDFRFVGVAGAKEAPIPGMIDARGITWRQTVALLNIAPKMVGVGSGITMLAAGAPRRPKIYEIGVPDSISMDSCGYAPSTTLNSIPIQQVANILRV